MNDFTERTWQLRGNHPVDCGHCPPHGVVWPMSYSDPMFAHAKELRDMQLTDLNKWPGHFMRKFNLTYNASVEAAEYYAKMAEVGPYAPKKKEFKREYS